MKLVGMLIILGGVLALVYFLVGDITGLIDGDGDATLEPIEVTSEVMDKLDSARDSMKDSIDKILK